MKEFLNEWIEKADEFLIYNEDWSTLMPEVKAGVTQSFFLNSLSPRIIREITKEYIWNMFHY